MHLRFCFIVVVAAACALPQGIDLSSRVLELTGGLRTRVVWVEGGTRLHGGGAIRGFDTESGTVTTILPPAEGQNKPLLCSDGHRVVLTRNYQVYVVNWDGSGLRPIAGGICSDVWRDPATGLEWAVIRAAGESSDNPVYRYLIDDPSRSMLLWDKSRSGDEYMNWYQISADGTRAVDFLPWDRAFVIDSGGLVTNGFHTNLSRGCWSTMASDNSYYWVNLPLTGIGHAGFNVFRDKTPVVMQLPITAPRPPGTTDECYHPRFASNGGRFISITSGYLPEENESDLAEVFVGKFNESYTGFDGWVQITDNKVGDYTPDAWIGVTPPSPSMRFSTDSLSFTLPQGGTEPRSQVIDITTAQGTLSQLTVSSAQEWLQASASPGAAGWQVTATVSAAGLASGVYRGVVSVTAPDALPALRTFRVTLIVTATPVATSLQITPASSVIVRNGSVQLTATVYDQMEQPLQPQPPVDWQALAAPLSITPQGMVTAGTQTGRFRVIAATSALTDTARVVVVEFIPVHIKINCGDQSLGYVPGWEGDLQFLDSGYTGNWWPDDQGHTIDFSLVPNPPPRDVYVRFRGGEVRYTIPPQRVPAGDYRIRLHFWEPYRDNPPRLIDFFVDEVAVLEGMRILAEAGGKRFTAIVQEYDVHVTTNGLRMRMQGSSPMITGMEIISSGSLAQQITLLEPLGGESFQVGEALTVRWSMHPSVSGVGIEYSPDNGENWHLIVDTTIANTSAGAGAYRWSVTPTVGNNIPTVSDEGRIRVYNYTTPSIHDLSPAVFSVTPSAQGAGRTHAPQRHSLFSATRRRAGVHITINAPGPHTVELFSLEGSRIAHLRGEGNRTYGPVPGPAGSTCAVLRVRIGETVYRERVLTLR